MPVMMMGVSVFYVSWVRTEGWHFAGSWPRVAFSWIQGGGLQHLRPPAGSRAAAPRAFIDRIHIPYSCIDYIYVFIVRFVYIYMYREREAAAGHPHLAAGVCRSV